MRLLTCVVAIAFVALIGCSGSSPADEVSADKISVEEISVDATNPPEALVRASFGPDDWPGWRGPTRDGIAQDSQVPLRWSATENIVWKSPIPGRGHSSPTVVGDRIFLATALEHDEVQSVVCFDRSSGTQLWKTDLHTGGFNKNGVHRENTHAACTIACDGKSLFVAFHNGDAVWASALDFEGNKIWQKKIGSYKVLHGYAPSPVIHKSLVIFAADNIGGGYLAALSRKSGRIIWRKSRAADTSYSSPVVLNVSGRDQLLISGCNYVSSYDPNNGEELWSVEGTTSATCGTMVAGDDVVFASGGFPGNETLCVRADGSGEVLWRKREKAYVPSMLLSDGYLYAIDGGSGIGFCFDAASGKRMWKARFVGGRIRSSPVLSGKHIYLTNVRGTTFVFRATASKLELVAENKLGDEAYATPAICGGRIYLRAADRSSGTRKESLYCVGTTEGT